MTRASKPRPFDLPAKRTDGHRVDWWVVGTFGIRHRHAIYHVDTKWDDLFPTDPGGTDLVNHWQLFDNDNFNGRTSDGWTAAWKLFDWRDSHPTECAALRAHMARVQKHIAWLQKETKSNQVRYTIAQQQLVALEEA